MKSMCANYSQRGLKTKTSPVLSKERPMKVGDFIRIVGNAFSSQIAVDKKINLAKYKAVLTWFTDVSSMDTRAVENIIYNEKNDNFINKIMRAGSSYDIPKEKANLLKSKISSKGFEDAFEKANLDELAIRDLSKKFKEYGYNLNKDNIPSSLAKILNELLDKRAVPAKLNKNLAHYQKYIENYLEENVLIKNIIFRYEPISFYDLYVCNRLSVRKDIKDKNTDYIDSSYPATLIEKYGHFITITGPAGYGKSMYLKHLSLCEAYFKDEENVKKTNLIPVLLKLNNIKKDNLDLENAIYEEITKYDSKIKLRTVTSSLNSGRFMLLFDALDELDASISDIFIRELESFTQKYKENVFILSSRPNNLSILDKFKDLVIERFNRGEIEKFCRKIGELTNIGKDKTYSFIGNVFLDNPHGDSIDSIPLILTLKFYIYKETGKISHNNSTDFYHQCFHLLFSDHDQINNKYNGRIIKKYTEDELKIIIGKFSYLAILNHKISFEHNDIANLLKKGDIDIPATEFINYLLNFLCIFYKEKETYHFIHRSFQDYFAACYIHSLKDDDEINSFITELKNFSLYNYVKENPIKFTFYWIQGFDDILKFLVDMDREWFEEKVVLTALYQVFDVKDIDNPILNYVYHTFDDIWWSGGIIEGADPCNSYKNDLIGFIANEMLTLHYDENNVRSIHIPEYAQEEFYVNGTDENGDPKFISDSKKREIVEKKYGDDWVDIDYCDGHTSCADIKKLVNDNTKESKIVLKDIEDTFRNNYLSLNQLYNKLKEKYKKH